MPDFGNTGVFSQTDASNASGTMPSWSGAAAPSTLDDAGRAFQGAVTREWNWRSYTLTAGGTADAKTLSFSVAPAAYYNGQRFAFIANTTNTASATLNVNSLGAKTIKKMVKGNATNLDASEMYNGAYIEVSYNLAGDYFVWTNYDYSVSILTATADVTPGAGWGGQLTLRGAGYLGGLSLDASGIWLGSNSSSRAVILAIGNAEKVRLDTSGNFTITSTGVLGYGTGSGGTVTQLTSKATAVTLNKTNGKITTTSDALGASANTTFAVNNTTVTANDTVIVSIGTIGTGTAYRAHVSYTFAGGFYITLTNISGGSLSEAVPINFAVIKAVTS